MLFLIILTTVEYLGWVFFTDIVLNIFFMELNFNSDLNVNAQTSYIFFHCLIAAQRLCSNSQPMASFFYSSRQKSEEMKRTRPNVNHVCS